MPIKVVRIPSSPNLYLRGTVRGQSVYETTGTQDPEAAEALRIKKEKELLDRSIYGERVTRSFAAAALAYMEAPGASEREQRFLLPLVEEFGSLILGELTQERLDRYIGKRYRNGSPATILRSVITPVTSVMNFAARRKWCEQPHFDRPKQPKGRRRWATYDEAARLINAASPHIQRLIIFLLFTGARMSEALELEWTDVDLERGWVVFRDTKRNGEDRGIPLAASCAGRLGRSAVGCVFRSQSGEAYVSRGREEGGQIKTAWRGTLRRAGLDDLRPHDLRHTFSTWLLMAGVHDQVKDELMGHASTSMGRRYSHVPRQALVEAVARLPRLDVVGEKEVNKKQRKPIYAIVPTLYTQ